MEEFRQAFEAVSEEHHPFGFGYLISYLRTESKSSFLAVNTLCVGMEGKNEIRRASPVSTVRVRAHYKLLNYPITTIQTAEGLTSFLRDGGHAIVEESLLDLHWHELLDAKLVTKVEKNGFESYLQIEKHHKRRFATGPERMSILVRDKFQCRICGSSPDDNIHIRLEVHHIKPWEEGGLTIPNNLITLCKTCHEGVSIVDRNILYAKVGLAINAPAGNIFTINPRWSREQQISYSYLLSNTVSFEIKTRRKNKYPLNT